MPRRRLLVLVASALLVGAAPAAAASAAPAAAVPKGLVQWSSPSQGATVVSPQDVTVRLTRALDPTDDVGDDVVRVAPDGHTVEVGECSVVRERDVGCATGRLQNGHYRVVAHLTGLGNSWTYDGPLLDFDVRAGLVPAPSLLLPSVNGYSAHDAVMTGYAAAGSGVQVVATDSTGRSVQGVTTARPAFWVLELDVSGLADGPLEVVATRTDRSGALPARARVVKDSVAPAPLPVQVAPGADTHTWAWTATLPGPSMTAALTATDHLGHVATGAVVSKGRSGASAGSVSDAGLADGPVTLALLLSDLSGNQTAVPAGTVTKEDVPSIDDAYARYRAAGLDLGTPLGPEQERDCGAVLHCVDGIRSRAYTAGEIWSAEGIGTFEVQGPIAQSWHDSGGVDGAFGMLVADQGPAGPLGAVDAFQGGDLFWSQATGVQPLTGAYATGYAAGSASGLGVPTGPPVAAAVSPAQPDRTATFQPFTGGRVYVSAAGPQAVWGDVARELAALGGEGAYGLPRTGELPQPGGVEVDFDAGRRILWSPATGAHELHGLIASFYGAGGPAAFGFPVADEEDVPGSSVGARQSRLQDQTLVWSPGTGVLIVHGEIGRLYEAKAAILGAPSSNEVARFEGEVPRVQQFVGGRGYWSPWTGAHEVHGEILRAYRPDGHVDNAQLGLPTSDEYLYAGQPRSDFEHGYIRWSAQTGAVITYT